MVFFDLDVCQVHFLIFSLNVNGPKYSSNFRPNRAAQIDPTRSPAKASIPKWKWNPTPPPAPPLLPPPPTTRRPPVAGIDCGALPKRQQQRGRRAGPPPGREQGGKLHPPDWVSPWQLPNEELRFSLWNF